MAAGIYVHVPFCLSKCPYCDFYSLTGVTEELKDAYTDAVVRRLETAGAAGFVGADTLYLGGGTPSLLGGERIARLIRAAAPLLRGSPTRSEPPEITLEANPADDLAATLAAFAAAGGNRLSMGMQSADAGELTFLGRRHTLSQLERAMVGAKAAGIENVSLDMMLGLSGQTADSVIRSAATCEVLGATHVSAYLLKVEPGTPFATRSLDLPDEDEMASLYLTACEELEARGYRQYEISNFARPGRESRHNLKYWNGDPYLGIGPAAHSFIDGKRWRYPRSLEAFLKGEPPMAEDPEEEALPDGGPEEYAMLRLRLTVGLTEADFEARFGCPIPARWRKNAAALPPYLLTVDDRGIRLTREGFLLSNALISRIL